MRMIDQEEALEQVARATTMREVLEPICGLLIVAGYTDLARVAITKLSSIDGEPPSPNVFLDGFADELSPIADK